MDSSPGTKLILAASQAMTELLRHVDRTWIADQAPGTAEAEIPVRSDRAGAGIAKGAAHRHAWSGVAMTGALHKNTDVPDEHYGPSALG